MRRHGGAPARRLSLLAVAVLAACSETNTSSGPPKIEARADMTYGAGDSSVTFGDVRGLAVDQWGRLYATDGVDANIKVFDSLGNLVRTIGRRGEGPGEFDTPQGVAFGPDGSTYVYDAEARRLTVLDSAGSWIETYPLIIQSYGYLWDGGIDSSGRMLDQQITRTDTTPTMIVRRLDLESGQADTIPFPRCEMESGPGIFVFPRGTLRIPYAATGMMWLDPSGSIWCAYTGRAVAYRYPFNATEPADSFISAAIPQAVTQEERDAAIQRAEEFKQRAGDADLDYSLIPENKAVLTGLDRDAEGRLWMRIVDSAGPMLHVFDPDGEWIARVAIDHEPLSFTHMAFHGNSVYAVGEDSLGARVVHRFTVDLPSRR